MLTHLRFKYLEPHDQNEINYPEHDQIDPDFARFLFEEHCAILVLEGLPIGSEFGIDLAVYRVGDKFRGVKLIPPGLHFIYAGSIDVRNDRHGLRSGFFHNFERKELLIKRWSTSNEEFDLSYVVSEEVYDRYKSNLFDLDRFLGVYKFSLYKSYTDLTNKIDLTQVARLMPDCGLIRSIPYLTPVDPNELSNLQEASSSNARPNESTSASNLLPHLQPDQSSVIHFTYIPKTHKDAKYSISPEKITEYYLDSSIRLGQAFGPLSQTAIDTFLAELQFSFLVFILCHAYDCFEHWKSLLGLICKSESSQKLPTMCTLYSQFIETFSLQIYFIPEDLFHDIDQRNNFVRSNIFDFFANINDNIQLEHLRDIIKPLADNLQIQLEQKFNWQFDSVLDDEESPLVSEDM